VTVRTDVKGKYRQGNPIRATPGVSIRRHTRVVPVSLPLPTTPATIDDVEIIEYADYL